MNTQDDLDGFRGIFWCCLVGFVSLVPLAWWFA